MASTSTRPDDAPMALLSDDALLAAFWRAAEERMDAEAPLSRALAGQRCLDAVTELHRRGVSLGAATPRG